jgi:hypothetical protein
LVALAQVLGNAAVEYVRGVAGVVAVLGEGVAPFFNLVAMVAVRLFRAKVDGGRCQSRCGEETQQSKLRNHGEVSRRGVIALKDGFSANDGSE